MSAIVCLFCFLVIFLLFVLSFFLLLTFSCECIFFCGQLASACRINLHFRGFARILHAATE
jgi:hypothetical protein